MDVSKLKAELALPAYAQAIASGDDQAIADLLNAPTAGTISRGTISKDQFVLALQSGLAGILAKAETDPTRQAFAGWLALLGMVSNIDTADAAVLATLAAAVQAGVFTQAEVDAATKRACSKAEQLERAGAVASVQEVSDALLPQRRAAYDAVQTSIRAKAEELMAANPDLPEREALERADQILFGHDWGHK